MPKLNSLNNELYGKKGRNMPKTRFFHKKVCFKTRFGKLGGIQQFISSQRIEIHHFRKNCHSKTHFRTDYIVKKAEKCPKTRFS